MGKLSRFFGLEEEKRSTNIVTFPQYQQNGIDLPNIYNNYTALNLSTVFACVNIISNSIAKLPIKVGDFRNNDRNIVPNHPVVKLFSKQDNGNLMSGFDIIKYLVASMILRGNGYAYISRSKDGSPTYLRFLESSDVTVLYDKIKDEVWYQCPLINGGKRIPYENMIHLKMWSYNGVEGVSVLGLMKRSLNIAHSTENTANQYFEKGCAVNGILIPSMPIQQQQVEQIKTGWSNNTASIQVLNAPFTWQGIGISSEDAEMLSSRKFEVPELCRWFLVPAVLVSGEGGQTYASLEMLQQAFLQNCLSAYISNIEAEFNRKFLKPSENGLQVYFETNELLRTTKKDSAEYYSKLVAGGILTVNEVRNELGYAAKEGGDDLVIAYTDTAQNKLNQEGETDTDNQEDKKEE